MAPRPNANDDTDASGDGNGADAVDGAGSTGGADAVESGTDLDGVARGDRSPGATDGVAGGGASDAGFGRDVGERFVETLRHERDNVTRLASAHGEFAVACRETGTSPEPIDGATFETFDRAERARDAARRYRAVLRSLDPGLDRYELAVCTADETTGTVTRVRERTTQRRENGVPESRQTVTLTGDGGEEWLRVENGPVVHLAGPDALLDDELVTRQLDSTLDPR
jgi:hypothetical protein